jgi:hypothetical protein
MARPNVPIPMPFSPTEKDRTLARVAPHQQATGRQVALPNGPKQSWHDHLKILLLRKAFLVSVTLAETHFMKKLFGKTLK